MKKVYSKTYSKTHSSEKVADKHASKIRKRGGIAHKSKSAKGWKVESSYKNR